MLIDTHCAFPFNWYCVHATELNKSNTLFVYLLSCPLSCMLHIRRCLIDFRFSSCGNGMFFQVYQVSATTFRHPGDLKIAVTMRCIVGVPVLLHPLNGMDLKWQVALFYPNCLFMVAYWCDQWCWCVRHNSKFWHDTLSKLLLICHKCGLPACSHKNQRNALADTALKSKRAFMQFGLPDVPICIFRRFRCAPNDFGGTNEIP